MISYGHHRYPGRLFVGEGTDGSGKSTQLQLLYQWLKAEGYPVFLSEWNSAPLVKATTRRAKKRRLFTPATFSLLHATDFADRTERDIVPPLKAGAIVLADRYIYTAFARDVARGCDREWVRKVYSFAVKPTLARSEEHTSELQSPCNLVCRLLLEKKNPDHRPPPTRLPIIA